jgi:hypothetical protein
MWVSWILAVLLCTSFDLATGGEPPKPLADSTAKRDPYHPNVWLECALADLLGNVTEPGEGTKAYHLKWGPYIFMWDAAEHGMYLYDPDTQLLSRFAPTLSVSGDKIVFGIDPYVNRESGRGYARYTINRGTLELSYSAETRYPNGKVDAYAASTTCEKIKPRVIAKPKI